VTRRRLSIIAAKPGLRAQQIEFPKSFSQSGIDKHG
jgi:hypothetical protein